MADDQSIDHNKEAIIASIKNAIDASFNVLTGCYAGRQQRFNAKVVCIAYFTEMLQDSNAVAELLERHMLPSAKKLLRQVLDRSAHICWIGSDFEKMLCCYRDFVRRYKKRLKNAYPVIVREDGEYFALKVNEAANIIFRTEEVLEKRCTKEMPSVCDIFKESGMEREYHYYYQGFSMCVHGNFFEEHVFRNFCEPSLESVLRSINDDKHDLIGLALILAEEIRRSTTTICNLFSLPISGLFDDLVSVVRDLEHYKRPFKL